MAIELLSQLCLWIALLFFIFKRCLRYLRFLQQEEYNAPRFIDWLKETKSFDKRGTFVALFSLVLFYNQEYAEFVLLVLAFAYLLLAYKEEDPRYFGKKKLVLTSRAKGILIVAVLQALAFSFLAFLSGELGRFAVLIVLVQSPPIFLIFAVVILAPKEQKLQNKLKAEAKNKFTQINPFTIGITGSFGKTSVKNLLGEILSMSLGPTFWPQKGVNTEMGITREIRERMNLYDKYAVVEMGAYHVGSIERLCSLTPVNAALITAVHFVHLERFGGLEQVYQAKSELPRNVPEDGILVVNGDNPGSRRMATDFRKKHTYIYGLDSSKGPIDSEMVDVQIEKDGTSFSILYNQQKYTGFTKMHGRGALSNILGCFTMACALGAKPEMVLAVIRDISAVSNRLEVKDYKSFIQINDAYNSNPQGFLYALEVLRDLPGSRRILITPGMIELGDKRPEENYKIAKEAAKICDLAIVVNEINKDSLLSGLKDGGLGEEKIKYFATRDEALSFYQNMKQEGDILLLENDLPDLLEFNESF